MFFLEQAKEVAQHPQWSKLLACYYETVKTAYQQELAKAGEAPDLQAKGEAGRRARRRALQAMLEGVDLAALETAWQRWIIELEDPWPDQRERRR